MSAVVESVVMIGDVEQFANVTRIAACDDYVTVTVHNMIRGDSVYSKPVPTQVAACMFDPSQLSPAAYAREMAKVIEEVASLVSAGALEMWLLDCGFTLN